MLFPSESQTETFSLSASALCFLTTLPFASLAAGLVSSTPESSCLLDFAHAILSCLNALSRPTPLHLSNFNFPFISQLKCYFYLPGPPTGS